LTGRARIEAGGSDGWKSNRELDADVAADMVEDVLPRSLSVVKAVS